MHRARTISRWAVLAGAVAAAAGVVVRQFAESRAELVGLAGAALVSFGLGEIYDPLLPISAGGWLLLLGWRLR